MLRIENKKDDIDRIELQQKREALFKKIYELAINNDEAALRAIRDTNGMLCEFASRTLKAMSMINNPELRKMIATHVNSSIFIWGSHQISDAEIQEAGTLNRLMIEYQFNYQEAKKFNAILLSETKCFSQSQQITLFNNSSASNVGRNPLISNQQTPANSAQQTQLESKPSFPH